MEEYNKNYIYFHNLLSKHYKSQNKENFDINIEKLINFLNKEKTIIHYANREKTLGNDKFIIQLMELKNNEKTIDDRLLENTNSLLYTEKKEIFENISFL